MKHDWILDVSFYYEASKYDCIDDEKSYICKNCGISGFQNAYDGEVEVMFINDMFLSCEEIIIKNIIE